MTKEEFAKQELKIAYLMVCVDLMRKREIDLHDRLEDIRIANETEAKDGK